MAAEEDFVAMALRDLNLVSVSEFTLKAEQESALTAILAGRDVLCQQAATGYGKSLIYQMFVRAKNHKLNGNASILVISPLKSIIEDPDADCSNLSVGDIHRCEIKILTQPPKK